MSFRYASGFNKPGFNPLAVQTSVTTYEPYLYGWGLQAAYGQLGIGNLTNYSSPKQVGSLSNWKSIVNGRANTASVKTDGTLWTCGSNGNGTLGLNNATNYSSPKQVGALTTFTVN